MQEKLQLRNYINIKYNNYSTKVLHTWEFTLKNTYEKVELWDSIISGKKKLAVNDKVIVEKNEGCAIFNYSFKLNGYYINLVQLSDGVFDLKINDFFFKDLMEYEESGQLKKDMEKREKNKDLKEEDNIDINAEYNPKSRKDRNNMNKNNKKNDLIDEDQKKLAFNYSIIWL